MAFSNPSRPQLNLPRHLHVARWVAIVVFFPVAIFTAMASVLLWQLSRGPVDVTFASKLFEPVAIASGPRPGHPAGRLTWSDLKIAWQPSSRGVPSGLVLAAQDLKILRLDGTVADRAAEADTVLSLSALTKGILSPRTLRLKGAYFALRRAHDGDVDLDLPDQQHKGRGTPIQLIRLTALDVQDVTVTMTGLPKGQTLRLGPVEAHTRLFPIARHSHDFVWTGWGKTTLQIGSVKTLFSAQGSQSGAASRWTVSSTPITPSDLSAFDPALARWGVPVSMQADLTLPAHGAMPQLRDILLHLRVGAGHIVQKTLPPLDIREAHAALHLNTDAPGLLGATRLELTELTLTVADSEGALTHLGASGNARLDDLRHPQSMDGDAEIHLDGFSFATLGSLWPENVMRGARRWIVGNITDGHGEGLHLQSHLHAAGGLQHIKPTTVQGSLDGHGLTAHWLRPIEPATGLEAHLGFDGPDALVVSFGKGQQPDGSGGLIAVSDGNVRITGLLEKDQNGDIGTTLHGPLSSFLTILAHPRLHLLSRHPLPFTNPSGDVVAKTRLTLPLTTHLKNSDMHFQASADYAHVHLGSVLFGRVIDGASGRMSATEDGLDLTGDGTLGGIQTHVALKENFRPGANSRVVQDITASALIDPDSAQIAGIGPKGLFTGQASMMAHYVQRANDTADLLLSLDLEHAGITIPIWAKPEGEPAQASGHLAFAGHDVTALDELQAHGRTLSIAGRGTTVAGKVRGIILEGFRIGRTQGDARIDLPETASAPVGVHLDADPLDLAPLFASPAPTPEKPRHAHKDETPSGAWSIDLHAPHVFYGPKAAVGGVVSHFELRNGQLVSGQFALEAPTHLTATLKNSGREHPFQADIKDLGALLAGLGLYDRISGGEAHLNGVFTPDLKPLVRLTDRDMSVSGFGAGLPPFRGKLEMSRFEFLHPPGALTAVSFLSPLHWATTHSDHFEVDRLSMPMQVAGRVLMLHDGVIGNGALGATVQGPIDLDTSGVNLEGTIVPLFGLNALPSHLPGIGHVLTPEKGGGILAAAFTVRGTVGAPEVSVNPLTMLLPGILRNITH